MTRRRALGFRLQLIDNSLYDAFGQREVSTMYTQLNQYYVVMEVAPQFWQNPDTLKLIHLASNVAQPPPALSNIVRIKRRRLRSLATSEASNTAPAASTFVPHGNWNERRNSEYVGFQHRTCS